MTDNLPPHSPTAEVGVLGCCVLDHECIGDAMEILPDPAAFYSLPNRLIWNQLLLSYERKQRLDGLMLADALKNAGELEQAGGEQFVTTLSDQVPSPGNLTTYTSIVRQKWLLRRMISACQQTVLDFMAEDGRRDAEDMMAEAEQRIQAAAEVRMAQSEVTMRQVMIDVTENHLQMFRRGVKFRIGPMTGFNYLDSILPGLGKGQLIVIAARPRTGKSAWMMQTAEHIALVEKAPVGIFSLEMTARSLGLREVFQRAGADLTKFLNGYLIEKEIMSLTTATALLAKAPIYIDESPRIAIEDLEVRARRMVRKYGIKVFFVDYFQLLYSRNARNQWSKSDELAHISMRLKGLAKELGIPIVLCAQMNRQIEQDFNRRPRLADLKDTGQLEQDADVVMFLWKPALDMNDEKSREKVVRILGNIPVPGLWKTHEKNKHKKTWKNYLSITTCTVEKQREGRSGEDATMVLIKPWVRFVDAYNPPPPEEEEEDFTDSQPEQQGII